VLGREQSTWLTEERELPGALSLTDGAIHLMGKAYTDGRGVVTPEPRRRKARGLIRIRLAARSGLGS